MPIWRIVFITPEAAPAIVGSTLYMATVTIGPNTQPMPPPAVIRAGWNSHHARPTSVTQVSQAIPAANRVRPVIRTYLPPIRSAIRPATGDSTADTTIAERHHEPGCEGAEVQHRLQIDHHRQEQAEHPDLDGRGHEAHDRVVAVAEEHEGQQRFAVLPGALVNQEQHQQQGSRAQQRPDPGVPVISLALGEREGQAYQCRRGEYDTRNVQLSVRAVPDVGHERNGHRQDDRADQDVDEEDPPPVGPC